MTIQASISLPDILAEAADALAYRLGVSRSRLCQLALEAYIEQHGQQGVTEALDAVHDADPEGSRLDPVLESLQRASLVRDDW